MMFLKILSILFQAYTLPPPIRDDLAVLQHHPYQIEKSTDPSDLAKRQTPVATLYWDGRGNIKAIFNVNVYYIGADIFRYAGVSLAQSILTGFQEYMANEPEARMIAWPNLASQIGREWRLMFQRPHGAVTVGILVKTLSNYRRYHHMELVLASMQRWFARSGYIAIAHKVANAVLAGNVGENLTDESSITENQTVGARSDSKFCELLIQNWPFVFTPGKLDSLLALLITC